MFDEFFHGPASAAAQGGEGWFAPACDIQETESHYVLTMDAPGIRRDDLKIELRGNQLSISGRRHLDESKEKGQLHLVERRCGRFERIFALPDSIEPEKIEADYHDGVLAVAVPKAEAAKPRQVPIGASASKPGFLNRLLGKEETGSKTNVA
jgi:HSP20 family protein